MDNGHYLLDIVAVNWGAPEELVIKRRETLIEHRMGGVLKLLCVIEVQSKRHGDAQLGLGRGERAHG